MEMGIFYKGRKQDTSEVAFHLTRMLQQQSYVVRTIDIRDEGEETPDEPLDGYHLLVGLVADVHMRLAARVCSHADVPIVVVNCGRVGFLTELEPDELETQLPYYLHKDASVWMDNRTMLHAVLRQDGHQEEFLALNDIVIARGTWPRVVKIQISVDEYAYSTTYADGIILSTATGSTAYNIAVGGPLLHPQVQSSVLTPIAPHLASDRSLILQPEARVKLQIFTGSQDGVFSADGQMNRVIKNGARVSAHKSSYVTQFLRRRPPTYFYEIINNKLKSNDNRSDT